MKNQTRFFLPTCVVCLAFSSLVLAQDVAAPDAKTLLQKAHEISGPSLLLPYEMHAAVIINPRAPTEKHGKITIYRDKDRSLTDLQVEDYRETRLTLGNKLYITRSTPYPVPDLVRLAEIDRAWDRLAEDGDTALGNVSHKKVQNTSADCFEVKGLAKHRLCYDVTRNVLLETLDQLWAFEFSDYQAAGQQLFPHKIMVLLEEEKSERPILTIQEIDVRKAQFADTAFAVPEHALELDTCEAMVPAKPLQMPRPSFGMTVARRNASARVVHVYAIANKEGSLENIKILSSDAEVRQAVQEVITKWRYSPAMCGSSPVATEKEIQIPISDMGGGGGDAGGRGR